MSKEHSGKPPKRRKARSRDEIELAILERQAELELLDIDELEIHAQLERGEISPMEFELKIDARDERVFELEKEIKELSRLWRMAK